ncbi:MAG: hypothetical protein D6753_04595 [Planctomycetota bacterium]|nr:MAG: hypothetical protein D6753_04595 [Planctomycetota bacterium]
MTCTELVKKRVDADRRPIGVRPIVDFAFKKIFRTPANKLALIRLLDAVLQPPTPITDVQILNPFNDKECWRR